MKTDKARVKPKSTGAASGRPDRKSGEAAWWILDEASNDRLWRVSVNAELFTIAVRQAG